MTNTLRIIQLESFGYHPCEIAARLKLSEGHVSSALSRLRAMGKLKRRSNPYRLPVRTSLEKISGTLFAIEVWKKI